MEQEILENKLAITEAAVRFYVKHDERFTLHQIAKETEFTVAEIFDYFDSKEQILRFYYSSLIIRYRLMVDEIEDFESYTLSEKLSNFIYASFDLMNEHENFVMATFNPLILRSYHKTDYEKRIEDLFAEFVNNDNLTSASSSFFLNECSFRFIRYKYLRLVSFWLKDESENKEVTTELTDKLTGLLQEAMYTSIADRSVDLIKFLYSNSVFSCDNRFWNKMSSTFEV